MKPSQIWVIGAALASVLVIAGGYFLGIAPQFAAASAADQQRAGIEAQNAIYEVQLAKLQKDFKTIDDEKAKLAALRTSVPASPDLSDFLTQLNELAAATQVTVTSFTTSDALPYPGPSAAGAAQEAAEKPATEKPATEEAPADGDADTATAEEPSEPAAAPATTALPGVGSDEEQTSPLITPDTFAAIPVTLTVTGGDPNVQAFLAAAQSGKRLFLVNAFTLAPAEAAPTEEGAEADPNAPVSSFSGTLSGYVYVLLSGSPAESAAAEPAAAAPAAG